MAPLHHHFEMLGWSETQVTMRFWMLAMMAGLIGVAMALVSSSRCVKVANRMQAWLPWRRRHWARPARKARHADWARHARRRAWRGPLSGDAGRGRHRHRPALAGGAGRRRCAELAGFADPLRARRPRRAGLHPGGRRPGRAQSGRAAPRAAAGAGARPRHPGRDGDEPLLSRLPGADRRRHRHEGENDGLDADSARCCARRIPELVVAGNMGISALDQLPQLAARCAGRHRAFVVAARSRSSSMGWRRASRC